MATYFRKCSDTPETLNLPKISPGVFFDRDGTIIAEKNYLQDTKDIEFLPGVITALRKLQQAGLPMFIITNQAGIAHGYFSEETLNRIHFTLIDKLKIHGVNFRGIYYCPHHPQAEIPEYRINCGCRKPNPGLLQLAALHENIELHQSYMIGDKFSDLKAGHNVDAKTALVLTGYGLQELSQMPLDFPDFIGETLERIVDWIISDQYQL